jgi:outer membrane protein OmpA-like peptidoglycan-associated protein
MRFLSQLLTPGLIALSACALTACSSTPDRYAFWRDDASSVTNSTKPNLANVPTSPNVDQARQDMQDLQNRLAADRQAAYQQAQQDQNGMTTSPSVVTTSPAAAQDPSIQESNLPPISHTGINNMAAPGVTAAPASASAPAIPNPNRSSNLDNIYPVYTSPSVQINRPSNPLPQAGTINQYVYGRSPAQFRQAATAPTLTPPAGLTAVNSDSITVDLGALGGGNAPSPRGGALLRGPMAAGFAASGSPTIYFNHGSARLSPSDKRTLSSIASAAQQGRAVKVIGHASKRADTSSSVAAKEANLKISATRASVVMKELARKGVNAKQIQPIALGDSEAAFSPSENKARRVDIVVE